MINRIHLDNLVYNVNEVVGMVFPFIVSNNVLIFEL